jgi:hypothetical protein
MKLYMFSAKGADSIKPGATSQVDRMQNRTSAESAFSNASAMNRAFSASTLNHTTIFLGRCPRLCNEPRPRR